MLQLLMHAHYPTDTTEDGGLINNTIALTMAAFPNWLQTGEFLQACKQLM